MYAAAVSPFGTRAAQGFGNAYRQVGIQTGVESASPHRLVAMLFDGLIESIDQARGAMQAGQIDVKGRAIGRAVRIVEEGLKGGLNASGGTLAADLGELYGYVVQRLTFANVRNDPAALDECRRLIDPLREAWASIAPQVAAVAR